MIQLVVNTHMRKYVVFVVVVVVVVVLYLLMFI